MPDYVLSLRQLVAEGKSLEKAAAAVGVSRTTAHKMLDRWGMAGKKRRTCPRLSEEKRARMATLLAAGYSQREIARQIGCDHRTVARYSNNVSFADCRPRRCCSCGYRITSSECLICLARVA
ncbi:helix-turn-helix domain-containing protein [Rosistilla oblonga]|uniref:helix-turn-helix domain-containing protein n=1 Tax=Rosistilla oblonga TaxID=2527990 RepID=UPI003A97B540